MQTNSKSLILQHLGHFCFKSQHYIILLLIINVIYLRETGPVQKLFSQHCGYLWSGHRWLQCLIHTHVFPIVYWLKAKKNCSAGTSSPKGAMTTNFGDHVYTGPPFEGETKSYTSICQWNQTLKMDDKGLAIKANYTYPSSCLRSWYNVAQLYKCQWLFVRNYGLILLHRFVFVYRHFINEYVIFLL